MKEPLLGVDIGSVSIALVLMSADGGLLHRRYRFHQGLIRETLLELLAELPAGVLGGAACTSSSPEVLRRGRRYDGRVCAIEAARRFHGPVGSLLLVGGEKFTLLRFDGAGNFRDLRSSTSCAAGTGSFLDQQAGRLGLAGSGELAELALRNRGVAPQIASRCSVFAKTDLCHAQQAGYTLEEICDGLCLGLARNIADIVSSGEPIPRPAAFAGGVSRNPAVVKHLEALLGCPLSVGEHSHLYGAIGACLQLAAEMELGGLRPSLRRRPIRLTAPEELLQRRQERKRYFHPPLILRSSEYPDFDSGERSLFRPKLCGSTIPVEVEVYAPSALQAGVGELPVVLGVDVGSTSTKAMLTDARGRPLAGFYTRTSGRPLLAVQSIFEALEQEAAGRRVGLRFLAAGTTGAGRQFAGAVIGADLVLNEITAHARAAWELEPGIDTIIEIGGQDSKFTVLRDGLVSFSQMNTVCAAGTGSFIEEQAAKLGVPLEEVSRRAEGVRAPLASDRCTVFMERDINHYLNRRYTVEEILAAALCSVRENYLLKVASPALIGKRVCFQGATARNRALVAAFEQKLGQPIFVSRYCHLTGALGVALSLTERLPARSRFRGLGLCREQIPVRAETCELCGNHCRLRLAQVQGETVAYGFLCGRDYDVKHFVSRNRSGFDLLREHRRAFEPPALAGDKVQSPLPAAGRTHGAVTVGLPAALYLLEELPLWERFFAALGIGTVSSQGVREALKRGKELCGAEFCAPVALLHGHVAALASRCDLLFLPFYMSAPRQGGSGPQRFYCYYSQFAPSVVAQAGQSGLEQRCLRPLVDHGSLEDPASAASRAARRRTVAELHRALPPALGFRLSAAQVRAAYTGALECYQASRRRLRELYAREQRRDGDIRVVLVGRPYLVLSPEMNKGIPEIFASLGVRVFSQDMVPGLSELSPLAPGGAAAGEGGAAGPAAGCAELASRLAETRALLGEVRWHYAAGVLESAAVCAATPGLYPVLITAFKCSPDSFLIEYFRRLLDGCGKPYLILQIDEHDSSMGYETRVEAGVHSFRNHYRGGGGGGREGAPGGRRAQGAALCGVPAGSGPGPGALEAAPSGERLWAPLERRLKGRTLLFPALDALTMPLVAANLQRARVDARVLEEDTLSIQKSMRFNSGQCLPVNIITQEAVDYIQRHRLDPARVLLWMPPSDWACNFHLFPQYIKSLLGSYGGGMERVGVYLGDLAHFDISPFLAVGAYLAYLCGGLLRRLGCRIRPYERVPGQTDRTLARALQLLIPAFRGEGSRREAFEEAVRLFEAIPREEGRRPKVAIFGDLYVRDNDVMNQQLIHFLEEAGGEVVTTSYAEYMRIIADAMFRKWSRAKQYLVLAKFRVLLEAVKQAERRFSPRVASYLGSADSFRNPRAEEELARYGVRLEHHGESFDNLLKVQHLLREHPDLALFVQTNPAFCCPSLVTEAMAARIEELTGVPVVTLTYDGTGTFRNDLVVPYLRYAGHRVQGDRPCPSKSPS
jgi:predicted CoA-substrate-specific enzyme activase